MNAKLFGVISVYGLLIACAVLVAVLFCQREGKKKGLPADIGLDMGLWAVPPAVICSRIYYVIFQWPLYAGNPVSVLYIWEGGLAIYGALIGGALGLFLLSKRRKVPFLALLDLICPVVLLGQAIGRWGNYFNGEAYGGLISNPAFQFFPLAVQIGSEWHLATFFLEFLWNIAGTVFLMIYRKRTDRTGNVFFAYILCYGTGRFWIEGLRSDSLMLGSIRVSQLLSLLLVLAALIWFLRFRFKKNSGGNR